MQKALSRGREVLAANEEVVACPMAKRFTAPDSCSKPQRSQKPGGQTKKKGLYTRRENPNFVVEGTPVVKRRVLRKRKWC